MILNNKFDLPDGNGDETKIQRVSNENDKTCKNMITFICDASAEMHLISNIKQFNPMSISIREDFSGENRIKVEIIVSSRELSKVIDYLKQYYVKPYNGAIVYLTDYYT